MQRSSGSAGGNRDFGGLAKSLQRRLRRRRKDDRGRRAGFENLEERRLLANQPDLLVTAATAPASAVEGNAAKISISWTVKNQGSAAAVDPWNDAIYLSATGAIDSSSVRIDSLDESFHAPLAPGASYNITRVVTIPESATGSQFLVIQADDGKSLDESDFTNNADALPITLSAPAVDLTATGATAPSAAVAGDGKTMAVSWTVKNQGTDAAAADWNDAVYLGDSPTFDKQTARRLDSRSAADQGPLAAGASYTVSRSIALPDLPAGSHYLYFVANSDNSQGESDQAAESNDVFSLPITIVSPGDVDLAVTGGAAPSAAVAGNGQPIEVSYTVKNLGSVAAAASWTDSIYLSTQPTFDSSAISLGYYPGVSQRPLAGGDSYTISQSITLPAGTTGSLYLLFRTDSGDVQGETSKSNNVFSLPITVSAPNVDFLVTAASAPATAVVGDNQPIAVSYTVKNQGSDAAGGSWRDAVYVSDLPTFDSTARLLQSFYSGGGDVPGVLAAGASYSVNASISLPDTGAGARYLLVRTNIDGGSNGGQSETDSTNNLFAIPITLSAPAADLAISNPSAPATVEAGNGQSITVSWKVTNEAAAGANSNWYDSVLIGDDANFDSGDTRLVSYYSGYQSQLAAGASYVGSQTVTAPNVAPGNYQLVFVTDVNDNQAETQKSNNLVALPITFTQANVDLTMTGATAPAAATAGDTIPVGWTVKNLGGETAAGGWQDSVYLSDVPTFDSNARLLDSFTGPATLAAGASYSPQQTVTLPGSASGNQYLLFVTNQAHSQGETNYANNVYAVPISIGGADLAATALSAPSSAVLGAPIPVSWTVTNQGSVAAPGNWTDAVYLSDSPPGNPFGVGDQLVGDFTHSGPLAAGASYTVQQSITLPASAVGNRYLVVVTNNSQQAGDANPANNRFAIPITLSAPDLTLTTASAPASAVENDTLQVSWTVKNQGAAAAPANWYDAVYLSTSPVFDGRAKIVTSFNESSHVGLAAGASYTDSESFALPAFAVGGEYLLFVTNAFGDQPETDNPGGGSAGSDANNVFVVPITLSAPDLAVTAASAPATAVEGNGASIPINYTVKNQGAVSADGFWSDALYLSDQPTYDSNAQYLTLLKSNPGPLAAGASYSVTQNVTLPVAATGARYLLVVANFSQNQGESDATGGSGSDINDVYALPITLTAPAVDLTVTGASAPASATAGDNVPVSFTVKNLGTDAAGANWTDQVFFSQHDTYDSSALYLGAFTPPPAPLGAGASYTQYQNVPLSGVSTGSGFLLFVANSAKIQSETDFSNNAFALPITISAPDLAITSASAPASAVVGNNQSIAVSYTVQNVGSAPAHGNWSDALYVSDKPTFDNTAVFAASLEQSPPALKPGASYTDNFNITLPVLPTGAKYLLFVANSGGGYSYSGQPEADASNGVDPNNVFAVPITLSLPQVDLTVSNPSAPANIVAGESVPISFTVTNQGTDQASTNWTDGVFFSTQPTFDRNRATQLDSFPAGQSPLAAGASYTVNENLSISSLPLGPGYLFFVTNINSDQAETDGGANDAVSLPATIGAPDLAVTAASAASAANAGASINVSWTVANQGASPAPASWSDGIYLSTKPTFDFSATYLGQFDESSHAGLAAGASYSDSKSVTLPSNAPAGNVYLLVVTNPYASQPESDGGMYYSPGANNVYALPIAIGAPDLAITSASAPASAVVGNNESIAVSYTVKNQGTIAANGSWDDVLYLSDKPTYDSSATYLTALKYNALSLAAGSSYTQNDNVTLPVEAAGSRYLLFVANAYNNLSESDAAGGADANDVYAVPITLNLPAVDLVPSNPSAPASATLGQNIPFSFTVTNNGSDAAAAGWHDTVYYSTKPAFDSSAKDLGDFYPSQVPLAAGANYPVSGNVTLESSLPTGAGYLLFVANSNGSQAESDATNNIVSLPITLSAPDLAVTVVTAPATAALDGSISVSWTVANQGLVAAPAQWTDAVYISSMPDWQSGYQIATFSEASNSGLAAGASYTDTQNVTIPSYVRTGDVYLIVRSDIYSDQGDLNPLNNVFAEPIHISTSEADLVVSSATAPAAAVLGDSIAVSWTVANQGTKDAAANWIDAVYLSSKPTFDNTATFVDYFNAPPAADSPLAAGASYTLNENVRLPAAPTGPMYLLIVTNSDHSQSESDATNDVYSLPITLSAPDLTVTAASAPSAAALGQTIAVNWTTADQGSAPAPANWYDAVYVSNKNTFDNTATLLDSFYEGAHAGLAAGGSYTDSQNITLPATGLGQRYLLFVADAFNSQPETDETNNVFALPITLAAPDLTVSGATAPSAAALGNPISVSWTVKNAGSVDAPGKWTDAVYVSSVPTFDGTATFVAQFDESSQSGLAAGASYTENQSITLPSTSIGPRYLLFVTDSNQGQPETDATNDVYALPISVSGADLKVASGTAPAIAAVGSTIDVSWTVANQGNAAAQASWSDGVYLSNTNVLDGSATYVGSFSVGANSPLAAGASYTQSEQVTIPNTAVGSRFMLFVADSSQSQAESNEANNTLALPIQLAQVDLAANSIAGPASANFGDAIDLSWTASNAGSTAINQPWSDRIYLSSSSTFDANAATLLATVSESAQAPLAVGASYTQTAHVALPLNAATTPGSYYLFVFVDGLNQASETNENNNTASQPITLGLPPLADLALANIVAPASGLTGQGFNLSWTDQNNGTAAANGPWTDNVFLSTDQNPADGLLLGSFSYAGSLAPGDSATRTQHFTYPGTPGQYYVIVRTNANGAVQEGPAVANDTLASSATIDVAQAPLPDLVVTAVVAPPDGSLSGTSVPITYTVTNQGTAPTQAPVWYDYVFISQDPNLSFGGYAAGSSDQTINNVVVLQEHVAPVAVTNASYLNPGQSYQQTVDVTLPIGASGPWYAYVVTDGLGMHFEHHSAVAEADEANNLARSTGSFNVSLAPAPDLTVSSLAAPSQAFSGQPVSVNYTVTNSGGGAVPASESVWYDQLYLSTSQSLDSSAVLLNTFAHNGVLAAGQSYSQQVTVTLPVGVSGKYYFIVKTNSGGQVFENGATDNDVQSTAGFTNVNLTPPPDLVASSLTAPANALASHTLAVSYQVTNSGSTATPNSSWTDTFYLAAGASLDPAHDLKLGDVTHSGSLDAGASYAASESFTLPDGLSGSYHVYVVVDSGAAVFELDKTNNTLGAASATQVASQPADLVVSAASAPAAASSDQAIPVSWTVTNQGSGDTAVSDWVDFVYADQGTTLDANRVFLGAFRHHGLLNAGDSYSQTQWVTIPIGFSGSYNLFVYADAPVSRQEDPGDPATGPNGSVYEGSNETNNVSAAMPIAITQQLADLTTTEVTAPAAVQTGASLTVSWQVQNSGAGATNATHWYDDVYLSPTATFDSSTAIYLGSTYHNNPLAAGGSYLASGTFTVPAAMSAANDYVIVRADRPSAPLAGYPAVNLVLESNETNNDGASASTVAISEAPTPHLVTSAVAAPATAVTGQTITVGWDVANQGADTGDVAWQDSVYLSLDQNFDPASDIYLGSITDAGGLASGADRTQSSDFTLPLGVGGSYYVLVVADLNSQIFERSGAADRIAGSAQPIAISFAPPVDLVAGTITVPANAVLGEPITLTYTVNNQSASAASGDWYDALYLDPGTTWQLSDPLVGRVHHTGGVAANGSYTETLTAPLPGVAPGTYHVILRSDIRNQILETNEDNNLSASLDQTSVDAPALTLGTPSAGTLDQGQSAYYKVSVAAGQTLQIGFASQNAAADNELYVSFGTTPSRSQFDLHGEAPLSPNQVITIPATQAGTYYILAYGASVNGGPAPFTITASLIPFSITAVSPAQVGNAGSSTIEIDGAKFDRNTTFELIDAQNNVIQASSVYVQDASTAFATFDLAGAALGSYDVQAAQSDNSTTKLAAGLNVVAGIGGQFVEHVVVPSVTLAGRQNVFQVNYANTGDASMGAPLLSIVSPTNTPIGFDAGDVFANRGLSILAISPDGPAGVLRAGGSNSVPVMFQAGQVGQPYHFAVEVTTVDNPNPIDWSVIAPLPADIYKNSPNWSAAWTDLQQRIGPTWGDYVKMLDRNAALQVSTTGMQNSDPIALLDLEAQQAIADVSTSIRGTLASADPGFSLAGRNVIAMDLVTGDTYDTTSLADGSFVFDSVKPGTYVLAVEGAIPTSNPKVTVVDGQHLTGVVLQIAPGGEVKGQVLAQEDNSPIANATVTAFSVGGVPVEVTSDAQGNYDLTGLAPGVYAIVATADGRASTTIANFNVALGENPLNISMTAAGVIKGSISLPGGQPNPGTLLVSAYPSGQPHGAATESDQVQGLNEFSLDSLPAGSYDITIELSGYLTQTLTNVAVSAGQTVDLGQISLTASAVISGQVTSSDSSFSLAGIQIGAYSGGSLVASAKTDGAGNFTIGDNLAAGSYTIAPVATSGFYTPQTATVSAGGTASGVVLDIEPGGSIAGTVTDSVSHATLSGVLVMLKGPGGTQQAATDANGNYSFSGLALGSYTVYINRTSGSGGSQAVQISSLSGPAVVANLQMTTEAELHGQLLTAAGAPIPGGTVRLYLAGTTTLAGETTADDNGDYGFWFTKSGAYDIQAAADGASFAPVANVSVASGDDIVQNLTAGSGSMQVQVSISGNPVADATVALFYQTAAGYVLAGQGQTNASGQINFGNLAAGPYQATAVVDSGLGASGLATLADGQAGTISLSLDQQATVSGQVTGSGGAPIAGATLALVSTTDNSRQWFGTSDANGNYSIKNVPFGSYNLAVVADGFEGAFVGNLAINSAAVQENVSLTPSQNVVQGRVIDDASAPVAGALVELIDSQGNVIGDAVTDSSGGWSIGGSPGNSQHVAVIYLGQTFDDPYTFDDPAGQLTPITVPDITLPSPDALGKFNSLVSIAAALPLAPQAWFQDIIDKTRVLLVFPFLDPSDVEPWCQKEYDDAVDAINEAEQDGAKVIVKAAVLVQAAQDAQNIFIQEAGQFIAGVRSFASEAEQTMLSALAAAGPDALSIGASSLPSGGAASQLSQALEQLSTALAAAETADDAMIDGSLADGSFPPSGDESSESGPADTLTNALDALDQARANVLDVVNRLETRWTILAGRSDDPALAAILSKAVSSLAIFTGAGAPFDLSTDPFAASRKQFDAVNEKMSDFLDAAKDFWKSSAEMNEKIDAYYECEANDSDGDQDEDDDDRHPPPPPPPPNSPDPDSPTGDTDGDNDDNGGNPGQPQDPNEIIGPAGVGDQHFVPAAQPLSYQILFENMPTASLPAQEVTITEKLDPNLDPRSFRLGDFGFGGLRFSPPPNSAFYQTTVDETQSLGFMVQVTATIDVQTATATWDFVTIDPATGEKLADFTKGFLPPDDATGAGEGFVSYTVSPNANVQTGDVVHAQATVVFDTQPPLDTAQIFNTLDTGGSLGSQVDPLPAVEGNPQFTVSWSPAGQPVGASAVADYSIFVSDDGGPFTPFLLDTTATQATFSGQKGHAYTFYSLAGDNAGNQQPLASAVKVSTTVGDGVQTASGLTISPVEGQSFSGAVATFTGADPNGSSADFTAQIDWGDGQPLTDGTISGSAAAGYTISGSHIYAEEAANVAIKAIIVDQAALHTTAGGTANVGDAPLAGQAATINTVEGATFSGAVASFTDADQAGAIGDFTAVIDWGDGLPTSSGEIAVNPQGGFVVNGSHVYDDEGGHTISVTISDAGGAAATVQSTANIGDAPLTSTGLTISSTAGATFSGSVATFTDANPGGAAGDFTATIDWGDGSSPTAGQIAVNPQGGFVVTGSHAFGKEGQRPISVTISDAGGASSTATGVANVADAPLTAAGLTIAPTEGATFSGAAATFTDADPAGAASQFSAEIHWGDGTSSAGSVSAGANGFTVSGSHVFAEEGANLPLSVEISDAGGAQATANGAANVVDAALNITAGSLSIPTGGVADHQLLATFVDTGGAEPIGDYTATIDWGDGSPSESGTIQFAGGVFSLYGSHSYLGAGEFTVGVFVHDEGGATNGVTSLLNVQLTANQKFVEAAYQDVLSRPVDAGGLAAWAQQLDQGLSRVAFAQSLDQSDEYFADLIRPLYQRYLGREADDAGLKFWVAQMHAGLTDERLEAGFIGSPEFYQHSGGTDKGWVDAMYLDLLGRAADSQGESFWIAQLAAGADRSGVAYGFAASLEREQQRVEDDYFHYLGRAADSSGVEFWVQQFAQGMTNEDLIAGFVGSEEYYNKHTT